MGEKARADEVDDDWAASIVVRQVGEAELADDLLARSGSWKNLFNNATGFIEARNSDGSWAGEAVGWTEGDHWAYSLDVMVCPHLLPLCHLLFIISLVSYSASSSVSTPHLSLGAFKGCGADSVSELTGSMTSRA